MGKARQPAARRAPLGRLEYPYYDRPGFSLSFAVTAYSDCYAVSLHWNGAACRRSSRRTLSGALTWAVREADRLLVQFDMPAKQVPLSDLLTAVEEQLAA